MCLLIENCQNADMKGIFEEDFNQNDSSNNFQKAHHRLKDPFDLQSPASNVV